MTEHIPRVTRVPRDFIELLLAKVDLVDLINTQIPLQKKSGSNYFARCPFHNEKHASFSVSQPKQFYHCFGCGAHGNAIDFLMQYHHLRFPEALETLAKQQGMEVPRSLHSAKKTDSLANLYDLMAHIGKYYYQKMRATPRAIHYLKKRGITGVIARQFGLGYAAPDWAAILQTFGKSEQDKKKLLEAGVIIQKKEGGYYDRFRDRIIFPIHDYRGRIVGFGGRIIDRGEPKYLNSPETLLFKKGHELYGLYQVLKSQRKLDCLLIVEGYMDVIALFQHGIQYAVATLGTATTSHHFNRLFQYTSLLIFCFDGDQAGRTAAQRALAVIFPLMQDSMDIRFLFLPEGEDPDSLIRKEGKTSFESRMNGALSLSDFFFQSLAEQCDIHTVEGRARFATLAMNQINQAKQGLFQNILLEELAKRTRIKLDDLQHQMKYKTVGTPQKPAESGIKVPNKRKLVAPLRLALALIMQKPSLITLLNETLPKSELPGYSFLLQLIEFIQVHPHITTGGLIENWRDQKEESFLAKLSTWNHLVADKNIDKAFLDTIRQLKSIVFDNEINSLFAKAAQYGLSDADKTILSDRINKKKTLV